jgi:hypothetical protein
MKLKDWIIPGATAVLAFAGSFGGAWLGWQNKDRELNIRMVEIGLSILKGDSTDEKGMPARTFAIELIKTYSGVAISDETYATWQKSGSVPFDNIGWGDWLSGSARIYNTPAILPQFGDSLACTGTACAAIDPGAPDEEGPTTVEPQPNKGIFAPAR